MQNTYNSLSVSSSLRDYQIFFNSNIRDYSFTGNTILIADERFRNMFSNLEVRAIYLIASEEKKTLEVCTRLLSDLHNFGANKSTKLIAVGGGIIQDITTLVASLYMRGLDWIYFPTTSMSQLDSCVGGKSSINLHGIKNIVGNIYPPSEIHLDASFYSTLSTSAIASGYLEALKISFAHGKEGFLKHLQLSNEYKDMGAIPVTKINELVLNQKKYFVEADEFDQDIRQNLNFGHTFGHAIESASAYEIPHGIAIGLGILMANQHPLCSKHHEVTALNRTIRNLLHQIDLNFAESLNRIQDEEFIQFFLSDKKHVSGNYSIIVAGDGGLVKITQPWDSDSRELILQLFYDIIMEVFHEV